MKSSTIRRSNLSKEKMAVLEALSKYRQDPYDNSPGIYVRPEMSHAANKEKELDMLWQNFKINQNSNKSPNLYLAAGFITGAVVMLILTVFISFSIKGISSIEENVVTPAKKEKMSFSFVPSSVQSTGKNEIYTVQDGDTMEAIVVRFYGSYSKEKEDLVVKTNNMTNPNKLSIGQQLTIPVE
jgi:hypothetical protein